eukprot:485919-Lingulodinium_polyedra.AAC.1
MERVAQEQAPCLQYITHVPNGGKPWGPLVHMEDEGGPLRQGPGHIRCRAELAQSGAQSQLQEVVKRSQSP